MTSSAWLLVPLALVAGFAVALQGAANSGLAARIGLATALVVNTSIVLLGTFALWGIAWLRGESGPGTVFPAGTPWTLYTGGLCGFAIIAIAAFVFPRIGAGYAIALMVAGQGIAALAIDQMGLLGMPVREVSASRIVGAGLLVVGILLLRR